MEFLRDTKIDFMGARRVCAVISAVAVVACLAFILLGQLNIGIDFAGGTQLIVKFKDEPSIDDLRGAMASGGLGDALIQNFGAPELHEVLIKTPIVEGNEEGSRGQIEQALDSYLQAPASFDLNRRGTEALASLLYERDPEGLRVEDETAAMTRYDEIAGAIMAVRQDEGLIAALSQLDGVAEVTPEVRSFLESETSVGPFSVLAVDTVGPLIGEELRMKGILAVLMSMLGMLAYIWWRFELRFGVGAVAAILHDVIISLGLYALAGYEFNLTTIAAFLTVVGYSVNDTVVVFDRVRENLRRTRREPLIQVLNHSLNQTLSRTLLTSGTTLLAVGSLFVFGGEVIRGFAFVLMIGVIVGTYSSIFVASPVVLAWENLFGGERQSRRREKPIAA